MGRESERKRATADVPVHKPTCHVCVCVRAHNNTNGLCADARTHMPHLARKNTRTNRSESHPSLPPPLPSKDHLDSATALTVAL